MDFRFDADEQAIVEEAGRAFRRQLPVDRLQEAAPPQPAWQVLGGDGWLHSGLPVEHGGAALPLVLVLAIAREAGSVLAVDEFLNNGFVIPALIARSSDRAAREGLLRDQLARPGFMLVDGRGASLAVTSGRLAEVPWCCGVAPGFDAYLLQRLPDSGYRLSRIAEPRIDFTPVAGLAPGAGTVSVEGGTRLDLDLELDDAEAAGLERGASLVHSASLVGVAASALELTLDYVKVREQFGRPVGQFQAVKHLLADVHTKAAIAWNAVLHAGFETDTPHVAVARLHAADAALAATKSMVQLLGGIAFTWEHQAHHFLKAALSGAARFGGSERPALSLGQSLVREAGAR